MRKHDRVFRMDSEMRSMSSFHRMAELVRNGRIGKLKEVRIGSPPGKACGLIPGEPVPKNIDYDLWLGPAPKAPVCRDRCLRSGEPGNGIFHIYDYAIGFLAGWGAHPLDVAHWGYPHIPVEYSGTGKIPTEGLFDTIVDWDVKGQRMKSGAQ